KKRAAAICSLMSTRPKQKRRPAPEGSESGPRGRRRLGELDAGPPLAGRFKMTRNRALLIFMIILMIALILAIKVLAAERSPSDWFALAVEIKREIEQANFEHRTIPNVNAEDRRFIRKMLNELSVSAEAKPTAAQGQWLLAIKEWVKAK